MAGASRMSHRPIGWLILASATNPPPVCRWERLPARRSASRCSHDRLAHGELEQILEFVVERFHDCPSLGLDAGVCQTCVSCDAREPVCSETPFAQKLCVYRTRQVNARRRFLNCQRLRLSLHSRRSARHSLCSSPYLIAKRPFQNAHQVHTGSWQKPAHKGHNPSPGATAHPLKTR